MKQTGIEYLIEQVKSKEWQDLWVWHKEEIFEQAKKLDRFNNSQSWISGAEWAIKYLKDETTISSEDAFDQCYRERFNENKDS